jgi:hypothetical protein
MSLVLQTHSKWGTYTARSSGGANTTIDPATTYKSVCVAEVGAADMGTVSSSQKSDPVAAVGVSEARLKARHESTSNLRRFLEEDFVVSTGSLRPTPSDSPQEAKEADLEHEVYGAGATSLSTARDAQYAVLKELEEWYRFFSMHTHTSAPSLIGDLKNDRDDIVSTRYTNISTATSATPMIATSVNTSKVSYNPSARSGCMDSSSGTHHTQHPTHNNVPLSSFALTTSYVSSETIRGGRGSMASHLADLEVSVFDYAASAASLSLLASNGDTLPTDEDTGDPSASAASDAVVAAMSTGLSLIDPVSMRRGVAEVLYNWKVLQRESWLVGGTVAVAMATLWEFQLSLICDGIVTEVLLLLFYGLRKMMGGHHRHDSPDAHPSTTTDIAVYRLRRCLCPALTATSSPSSGSSDVEPPRRSYLKHAVGASIALIAEMSPSPPVGCSLSSPLVDYLVESTRAPLSPMQKHPSRKMNSTSSPLAPTIGHLTKKAVSTLAERILSVGSIPTHEYVAVSSVTTADVDINLLTKTKAAAASVSKVLESCIGVFSKHLVEQAVQGNMSMITPSSISHRKLLLLPPTTVLTCGSTTSHSVPFPTTNDGSLNGGSLNNTNGSSVSGLPQVSILSTTMALSSVGQHSGAGTHMVSSVLDTFAATDGEMEPALFEFWFTHDECILLSPIVRRVSADMRSVRDAVRHRRSQAGGAVSSVSPQLEAWVEVGARLVDILEMATH